MILSIDSENILHLPDFPKEKYSILLIAKGLIGLREVGI